VFTSQGGDVVGCARGFHPPLSFGLTWDANCVRCGHRSLLLPGSVSLFIRDRLLAPWATHVLQGESVDFRWQVSNPPFKERSTR